MSSQDLTNYVNNPFTGRLIKRGSKTHKRLVSAKLLNETYDIKPPDNVIMDLDSPSEAKNIKSKMSKNAIGKNKIITTRGTKVLSANRRPTMQETINKVSDIAVDTVLENRKELFNNDMDDADMDTYIKQMIQIKLIGGNTKPKSKAIVKKVELSDSSESDGDY
jgi:hypothetical protein